MNSENKKFLDDNRWAVESYSQQSPPRHMRMMDRERLLKIVQDEFDSRFTADLWCDECNRIFILNAYNMYDNYLNNAGAK